MQHQRTSSMRLTTSQRHHTPQQHTQRYTVHEALAYWAALLDDLLLCCDLGSVNTWSTLKDRVVAFANRNPSPLARALFHHSICLAHKEQHARGKAAKKGGGKDGGAGGAGTPFPWSPSAAMVCQAAGLPAFDKLEAPEAREFVTQCIIGVRAGCCILPLWKRECAPSNHQSNL